MKSKRQPKQPQLQAVGPASVASNSRPPIWLLGLWLTLACFWGLTLLTQEIAEDFPRWTLFLIPDQAISGWFDGPVSARGIIDRISVLMVAAAAICLAGATGYLVVRKTYVHRQLTKIESSALSITIGLGLLSTVLLVVGLAGLLRSGWAIPITIFMQLAVAGLIGWLLQLFPPHSHATGESLSGDQSAPGDATELWKSLDLAPRLFALFFATLIIARATLPPAEYDVREYHLQTPKEWFIDGAITFLPHNIYANMPMAAEIHSLLTMMIWQALGLNGITDAWWWGAISGKIIIASFAISTSILIGGCVRILASNLRTSRQTALSAARWTRATALAFPAIVEVSSLGLIEGAVACFFAAGLLVLCCETVANQTSTLFQLEFERTLLVALCAGGAIACKYPAVVLILPVLFALWLFGFALQSTARVPLMLTRLRDWKLISLWMVSLLIVGGPWYLKNTFLADNPVYPLAANSLGGKTLSPEKIAQWNAGHETPAFNLQALLQSIGDLTWRWRLQGWVALPFAATGFAFLLVSNRRELFYVLTISCVYAFATWWLITHRIDRFLIPALPLIFIFAGLGWAAIRHEFGNRWAALGMGLLLLFNALYISGPALGDSRLLVSMDYLRSDDLSASSITRLPEHIRWINQNLNASDHVLSVGDAAVFDFETQVSYSTTFDRSPLADLTASPESEWNAAFSSSPYDYLLMHWGEIARLRATYGFDENITPLQIQRLVDLQIIAPVPTEASSDRWQLFRINK